MHRLPGEGPPSTAEHRQLREGEEAARPVLEKIVEPSPMPALQTSITWKFFLGSDLTPSYYSRFFLHAFILASQ